MKKNKKLLGIVVTVAIILVGLKGYYSLIKPMFDSEADEDSYDQDIEFVMNIVPTEILLYGEKIDFRDSVTYTMIDKIDENIFNTKKQSVYLIINDLVGDSGITKDELAMLKKLLDKNNKANLIYLGTKQADTLLSLGYSDQIGIDDSRSMTYTIYSGDRVSGWGLWTSEDERYQKKNPELIGELILFECAENIKSNQ